MTPAFYLSKASIFPGFSAAIINLQMMLRGTIFLVTDIESIGRGLIQYIYVVHEIAPWIHLYSYYPLLIDEHIRIIKFLF